MSTPINFDPNFILSGRLAEQTVRFTLGMWEYRKTIEVKMNTNIGGIDLFTWALKKHLEDEMYDEGDPYWATVTLSAENGDTLVCEFDGEGDEEDWLMGMVMSAELIGYSPTTKRVGDL